VVNFFMVLRNDADEFIRHVKLSPWAREEYLQALEQTDDPFEDARRFFLSCWMSMNGSTGTTAGSWRHRCDDQCQSPAIETLRVDHLYQVADRLRLVQFECRDALEVIPVYDRPGGLIYADPPYVLSTRGGRYLHDVGDEFQAKLAAILRECQAYVVVSGYPSEMYDKLYEGWARVDKENVQVNAGEKRTECLWLSPRTVDALSKPTQASLF
jgi:DNA adenine methylase